MAAPKDVSHRQSRVGRNRQNKKSFSSPFFSLLSVNFLADSGTSKLNLRQIKREYMQCPYTGKLLFACNGCCKNTKELFGVFLMLLDCKSCFLPTAYFKRVSSAIYAHEENTVPTQRKVMFCVFHSTLYELSVVRHRTVRGSLTLTAAECKEASAKENANSIRQN